MYQPHPRARLAGAGAQQYRSIEVSSRVEGASPHRLVAILYEELVAALAALKTACRHDVAVRRAESHTRALALLQALESGLDHQRGGAVAGALSSVYHEVARLAGEGARSGSVAPVEQAQAIVAEIAEAWNRIG